MNQQTIRAILRQFSVYFCMRIETNLGRRSRTHADKIHMRIHTAKFSSVFGNCLYRGQMHVSR